MKTLAAIFVIGLSATLTSAQQKTNDEINRQIKQLGVDHITLTHDPAGGVSKLMAVAENFSYRETDAAGLMAMNFAIGFFYTGTSLTSPPESLHFTFWAMSKRPRFADSHDLIIETDGRTIDLGPARYAAKPAQNMEYLNFDIPRSDLVTIASASKITFRLGTHTFTATASQLGLLRAVVQISGK